MGAGTLIPGGEELGSREGAIALTVIGGLSTVAGVSLASYALATEDGHAYRPPNAALLYGGLTMATLATTGVGVALMTCAYVNDELQGSRRASIGVACLLSSQATTGFIASGVLLWLSGGHERPADPALALRPGATGLWLEGRVP
jgi:hypothetical protein